MREVEFTNVCLGTQIFLAMFIAYCISGAQNCSGKLEAG